MVICPDASKSQNYIAAVSAPSTRSGGSTVWVLIRRLNSSCNPSWRVCCTTIAFDVRIVFHWLFGKRVKVNSLGALTATSALRQPSLYRGPPRANHSRALPVKKNVRLFTISLGRVVI